MKKVLSYAVAAILLGTVTMLVPVMVLESIFHNALIYGEVDPRWCSSEASKARAMVPARTFDTVNTLGLETSSLSNILSAGLMLVPSFLVALGVFIYMKKRVF